MTCRLDDLTNDDSRGVYASLAFLMSALGHKRTSHTLTRHVRFSAETRHRDAIG